MVNLYACGFMVFFTHIKATCPNCSGFTNHSDWQGFPSGSVVTTTPESKLRVLLSGNVLVCPSIAQLVERWTVESDGYP